MDDISRCRNQLASFRIKELKDVLTRLGLPKQGKKQVLMDKIMAVLMPSDLQAHPVQKGSKSEMRSLNKISVSREEAAKVIDDIYRKLRGPGAVELASGPKNASAVSVSAGRSDDQDETTTWEVRCPCGSSVDSGTMIQCDNQSCGIWQHVKCVVIPENTAEGVEPEIPTQFHCEICRINYGDPFCVTLSQPLLPAKLYASSANKTEGSGPLHSVEKTFALTKADRDILHKPNHDLQVWCLLLNDKVPFRMHWPAYADLRVNGVSVRVTNRTGTQLLGANGRDDGPGIITCTREGTNRISLSAYDARPFCMGVRIIRRRSVDQVLNLIPNVTEGEPFEEALARIRRCINGGIGDAADDGDSDLEVVAESEIVNLRCPMSGSRINIAGRFKPCAHMGGFDLKTFVELNQRARKWQCPVCLKNYSLEHLVIDPFFNRLALSMKSYGEDVTEVELKADGFWRPKLEGDARSREPWRAPDGSLVLVNGGHKVAQASVKIEEGVSQERAPLKIGIKRTHDGQWAVNRSRNPSWTSNDVVKPNPSSSRSSSATDSNNENGYDDERSVNQEPSAKDFEYTGDNEVGLQTKPNLSLNAWKKNKSTGHEEAPVNGNAGSVIVLSDSDEESGSPSGTYNLQPTERMVSPGFLSGETRKDQNANGAVRPESFGQNSSRHISGNEGDVGLPLGNPTFWSQPSQNPPYRFFDPGSDVRPVRPTPISAVANSEFAQNLSRADREGFSTLNEYGTGSGQYLCNGIGDDGTEDMSASESSLRLFLPPQPARAPVQSTVQDSLIAHDEELDDSWFSLSLGGGDNLNQDAAIDLRRSSSHDFSRPGFQGRERLDSLANTASVLLGLNNSGGQMQPSGSAGYPRRSTQHNAHRQRHYLRVESDSE